MLQSGCQWRMLPTDFPGVAHCSQPTVCRLENLSPKTMLIRMTAAMLDLFCAGFEQVPHRELVAQGVVTAIVNPSKDRKHPAIGLRIAAHLGYHLQTIITNP
jgi:hypothetical protein